MTKLIQQGAFRSQINKDSTPLVSSSLPQLNQAIKHHLTPGSVIEWGIPRNYPGRLVLLSLLKKNSPRTLWTYHHPEHDPHIPSWSSHGVELEKLYFLKIEALGKNLASLYQTQAFPFLILDSLQGLSAQDHAFIKHQSRQHKCLTFIIRPYLLSTKKGNPFANARINIFSTRPFEFELSVLKGAHQNRLQYRYQEELYELTR